MSRGRSRRRSGSCCGFAVFALGVSILASPAAAQPGPGLDPRSAGPFLWHEVIRHDERPRSPITESSTLVSLPAPLASGARYGVTLLTTYRRDVLRRAPLETLGVTDGTLHVLELGLPLTFRAARRWGVELDTRLAYASAFDEHGSEAWVPSVRAGATWAPATQPLALSLSVLYSPTVLDGVAPVPLLGLYYRPGDRPVRVDMLLPRYAEVAWIPGASRRGELYAAFHWEGVAWNAPRDGNQERLVRQEVRLDVGTRVHLLGPLGGEIGAHWVPRQSLAFGDATIRRRLQSDVSFTAALVLDKVAAGQLGAPEPTTSPEERP